MLRCGEGGDILSGKWGGGLSSRRSLAVLHIIKPATNPTLFVGDDACIVPHDGPCPIFYPGIQQIPPKKQDTPHPRIKAIPHNSKCRYGERGAADAKPKAQIILDAAKVSAASGGSSEPKQGQRSQSARGFCPRSTMRVPQPDIIEHFGNADAVPQLPERCLSRKAGIVRCCLKCPICRTTLKPFPLAEICRRWGFLKEGRSMAQPQCGKSLS